MNVQREQVIVFTLVETPTFNNSSSSSDSITSSSDDEFNSLYNSWNVSDDEENMVFFPLLQYLMTGHRRTRVEGYLLLVDSWTDLEFREHLRLPKHVAEELIDELDQSNFIPRHNFGRSPIQAKLSFYIFLWFLANTEPLRTLSDRFNVSISSVFRVVRRVVAWLMTKLDDIIKWSQGNNVLIVCDGFYARRNIPSVLGAIDSTHIRIERPSVDERDYYNRKKFHSINLQATVDSRSRFTNVYCGEPGSLHDARVFRRSPLYTAAMDEPETLFPNNTFLLGDSAYPSLPWLVPPFRDNGHLTNAEKEFNFLHSSTRMVVERAFGCLKGRFRRVKFFNEYRHISFVIDVIIAACILHNCCVNANDGFEYEECDDQLHVNDDLLDRNERQNDRQERRIEVFRELFPDA